MSRPKNIEEWQENLGFRVAVTEAEIVCLIDMVSGVKIKDTAEKLGIGESTVSKYRAKFKRFIKKEIPLDKIRADMHGLYPLTYRALAGLLQSGDKDTTFRVAALFGMLPGSNEDLKEYLAAFAGLKPGNSVVNIFTGMSPDEQRTVNANLAEYYRRAASGDRFSADR